MQVETFSASPHPCRCSRQKYVTIRSKVRRRIFPPGWQFAHLGTSCKILAHETGSNPFGSFRFTASNSSAGNDFDAMLIAELHGLHDAACRHLSLEFFDDCKRTLAPYSSTSWNSWAPLRGRSVHTQCKAKTVKVQRPSARV